MFHWLRLYVGRSENILRFCCTRSLAHGVCTLLRKPLSTWEALTERERGIRIVFSRITEGGGRTEETDDVSCNEIFMVKFEHLFLSLGSYTTIP